MKVHKQSLPPQIQSAVPDLLPEIVEYLSLEAGGDIGESALTLAGYFVAGSQVGFLVFEFVSDDGPMLASVQHALPREKITDGCISCWPRTEGQSIEWSLGEFLEYNPP